MREPVAIGQALTWWRAAIAHYPDTVPADPQPGYYKTRLAKAAIMVPARIWLVQDVGEDGELLDDVGIVCLINGEPADAFHWWPYLAGRPITYQEFRYLSARNAWAENYAPDDYAARPRERIDPMRARIPF